MQNFEAQWKQLASVLEDILKLNKSRTEQKAAYERLREQVLQWLAHMEQTVDAFPAVALEPELIKKQSEAIKVTSLLLKGINRVHLIILKKHSKLYFLEQIG